MKPTTTHVSSRQSLLDCLKRTIVQGSHLLEKLKKDPQTKALLLEIHKQMLAEFSQKDENHEVLIGKMKDVKSLVHIGSGGEGDVFKAESLDGSTIFARKLFKYPKETLEHSDSNRLISEKVERLLKQGMDLGLVFLRFTNKNRNKSFIDMPYIENAVSLSQVLESDKIPQTLKDELFAVFEYRLNSFIQALSPEKDLVIKLDVFHDPVGIENLSNKTNYYLVNIYSEGQQNRPILSIAHENILIDSQTLEMYLTDYF